MNPLTDGLDPMGWAKKPRSHLATAVVLAEAKRGADRRFVDIRDALIADGHVTAAGDVKRLWSGSAWRAATVTVSV